LADATPQRVGWAFRPASPTPRSIAELIRTGTLDAELAATLWVLMEGRVPVIVAGATGSGTTTLVGALLDFLPAGIRVMRLRGSAETYDWLPQAAELGWRQVPHATAVAGADGPVRPDTTALLADELSDRLPSSTWGDEARIAIRAATIGYGLATTIPAESLEEVLASLRRPPVALSDDESSRLGVVLVMRRMGGPANRRVVAAHYIRPIARDEHGHVQRLGPAVIATWDPGRERFEHFGWGVTPELAIRVGWRAGDFELEVERRRDVLDELAAAGILGVEPVRAALAAYRSPIPTTST
jgi:hypothetical protein